MEARTWNIIQLGIGFLLLFAGFNTQKFIEQAVLSNVAEDTGRVNVNAGYYSLAIIYVFLTFGNLIASPIVSVVGAKWALIVGSLTFVLFLTAFMYITTWSLYLTSAIMGFGGALLWTAQGNYLSLCSDEKTAGRNSGIVWAIYQTCLIIGSIFLFVVFQLTDKHIDESTIRKLYSVFTVVASLGFLTFVFLRSPTEKEMIIVPKRTHIENILAPFKLMMTKNMIILSVAFTYMGIELSFWSGVYPTCLAYTNKLNLSNNSLLAYNAFAAGLGQIVGALLFGVYGERIIKCGRYPITTFASIAHLISYIIIFINIPTQSPQSKTDEISIISPSVPLALFCSILLGVGDSCWITQVFSVLATTYKNQSSEAFAIQTFYYCLGAAALIFCGSMMELRWHLAILSVFSICAAVCFYIVERRSDSTAATNRISSEIPKRIEENEPKAWRLETIS